VKDIDIHDLWSTYEKSEPAIPSRIEGAWYELHVGSEAGNGIYSVTVGVEVSGVGELPVEVSVKVVPAGRYAHFVHRMGDGGFGDAFARVSAYLGEKDMAARDFGLQLYGADFSPQDDESLLHIYIPLAE
jgi:predicted transcriptional regulator YdeE